MTDIKPSPIYHNRLVVLLGYDSKLSTFEMQTWEVKANSATKLNGVSA